MSNKEISRALRHLAALLELHDENQFKVKSVQNASFQVDRYGQPLELLSETEILGIPGIGKSMASKIYQLIQTGIDPEIDLLLEKTPAGLLEILSIKGIGPKKVRTLWKDLEIESPGELLYACNENRLIELKGFGLKTQDSIKQALEFSMLNAGKLHYAEAEMATNECLEWLLDEYPQFSYAVTGELRRQFEVVTHCDILCTGAEKDFFSGKSLRGIPFQIQDDAAVISTESAYRFRIFCSSVAEEAVNLFKLTGPSEHVDGLKLNPSAVFENEAQIYQSLGLPFIPPVLRDWPIEEATRLIPDTPLSESDIHGILHCHSTWSDGANSLAEMADACRKLGKTYFGICDHSKSAFYANGLSIDRVAQQHAEIDRLNAQYSGFRIFKGIESDILNDGSLDYPDEILQSFDFIVASVHSVLRMDEERATQRLIKAVENPYTTILGHPSTRLLLSRKGFPIHYPKLIDACAANGVSIELNAHPYRLDLDWRWIPLCVEKGVKISINPDAHRLEGLEDIRYGVMIAQKAGLQAKAVLNHLSLEEFSEFLNKR